MGPKFTRSDRKACEDRFAGQKTMMAAETRRFDFENGRSVEPKDTFMLCGRILDTGLYWFCYPGKLKMIVEQFSNDWRIEVIMRLRRLVVGLEVSRQFFNQ